MHFKFSDFRKNLRFLAPKNKKYQRLARNPIFKTVDAKAVDQKCDQKLYKPRKDPPLVWKMPHTPLGQKYPKSLLAAKKDSFWRIFFWRKNLLSEDKSFRKPEDASL